MRKPLANSQPVEGRADSVPSAALPKTIVAYLFALQHAHAVHFYLYWVLGWLYTEAFTAFKKSPRASLLMAVPGRVVFHRCRKQFLPNAESIQIAFEAVTDAASSPIVFLIQRLFTSLSP